MNNNIILDNYLNNKNNYLLEMIRNQRKDIPFHVKLYLNDLKRIVDFIPNSIFSDQCCCWKGYITNINNNKKGTYINFYYKKKKRALHRLLFINFKDNLENNEYVRFKCDNKGFCCSINCMYKFKCNNYKEKHIPSEKNKKDCSNTIKKDLNFQIIFE